MRLLAALAGIVFGNAAVGGDNDLGLPPEPPTIARLTGAQPLLIAERQRQSAAFTGIDAQQRFKFDTESGPLSVTADQMVRWGNPVLASGGGIRVVLTGGSELVAAPAWNVDEPYRLDENSLQMTTLPFGTLSVRRSQVEAIHLLPPEQDQAPHRGQRQPDTLTNGRDIVFLANGDRLRGHVRAVGEDGVDVETPSGPMVIPLENLEAVRLATLATARPAPTKRLLLGFSDGSRLVVRQVVATSGDPSSRPVDLVSGVRLPWPGNRHCVYVQPLGGRVRYLSDETPAQYQHVPYLDLTWPNTIDRNVLGTELLAGNKIYVKGIGMHSASRLVFKLNGQYRRFHSDIAIDNAAGKRGSVTFRVFLAKESAWHESFKSPVVRGGDPPRPVSVDLQGARGLALVVDYADYGDERDLANWLDARLE